MLRHAVDVFGRNRVTSNIIYGMGENRREVLDVYKEEKLIENAHKQGLFVKSKLEEIKARHPSVGDVRGMGLFFCIELVNDRVTKQALDPAIAGGIRQRLLDMGLSTNVMRNLIFVGPPLCITEGELVTGLEIIDRLLDAIDREIQV